MKNRKYLRLLSMVMAGVIAMSAGSASAKIASKVASHSSNTITYENPPLVYNANTGKVLEPANEILIANEKYTSAFQVLNLVNAERAKEGLCPLYMDKELLDAAMLRASEIVFLFSHTRPSGLNCFTACDKMYAENIAYGSLTPNGVMEQWMNSPGHRANILGDYKSIGIGCVEYNGMFYWTQCFGCDHINAVSASSYSDKTVTKIIEDSVESDNYLASFSLGKTTLEVGQTTEAIFKWGASTIANSGMIVESSNSTVCRVTGTTLTALAPGTATITMYLPGYKDRAVQKTITVTSAAQNKEITVLYNANGGKVSKTSKIVKTGKTFGTLASPTRAGYVFSGWYTAKKNGTKITSTTKVTSPKNITLYAHWKKVSVKTAQIASASKKNSKTLRIKLKKTSGAKGYRIIIATDKNFKKNKTVKMTTKLDNVIKKLPAGKRWYIKVAAYQIDSCKKKIYGKYSKVKTLK